MARSSWFLIAIFEIFLLNSCMQAILGSKERWCRQNSIKTCWSKDKNFVVENFTNGYYLKEDSVNCTNSHIFIRFSFNINDTLKPTDISVQYWNISVQHSSKVLIGSKNYNLPSASDNITVKKEDAIGVKELFHLGLELLFEKTACGGSRRLVQSRCEFFPMCPELRTATSSSLETSLTLFPSDATIKFMQDPETSSSLFQSVTEVAQQLHKDYYWLLVLATSLLGASVLFGLLLVGILYFYQRKHRQFLKNNRKSAEQLSYHAGAKSNSKSLTFVYQKPVKIFLIFVNDNAKHLNVIKTFVNFLQTDLGFDVICEIFQTLEYSTNLVSWMETSFLEADKILTIWSEEAVQRWMLYNKGDAASQDLFSPVLKNIKTDLFRQLNREKYYFSCFDYFQTESIPKEFKDEICFRLMSQLEDLYYRLRSIEP